MNVKAVIIRTSFVIEQAIRILSMQFVLVPVAYALPRKLALWIADALAVLLVILPTPGLSTCRDMRKAYGKSSIDSFYLAWGWLARPLRDFVVNKRLANKRENPFSWRIVERNTDGINELRNSGETYILAYGHFSQVARISMGSPRVTYNSPFSIGLAPKRGRGLYKSPNRIIYEAVLRAAPCWGGNGEIGFVGDDMHGATILYEKLLEPGNVVFVALDAPWDRARIGTLERPFAGIRNRGFSMGAAQLARLTGCPIIACVPWINDDESIVIEWGDPMRIGSTDSSGELKVMNTLIDTLEIAIGKRPTQYYFHIGYDRRWNPQKVRWEDFTN